MQARGLAIFFFGALSQTFQTSLPAGSYCDVAAGDPGAGCPAVQVGTDGRVTVTVGANSMLAIHTGARS